MLRPDSMSYEGFTPFTPGQVAVAVKRACAVELDWLEQGDSSSEQPFEYVGSATLSESERERCGSFHVNVYRSAQHASVLVDPSPGERVLWLSTGLGGWMAFRSYGNVELIWSAGPEQRLDERWEKVDAALQTLN